MHSKLLLEQVESKRDFRFGETEDRLMILSVLLHAADISNVSKPYNISKQWSDRVFEEFLNQVTYLPLKFRETLKDNMGSLFHPLWIDTTPTKGR